MMEGKRRNGRRAVAGHCTLGLTLCTPPKVQELGRALAFLILRLGVRLSYGASCICAVCGDQPKSPCEHALLLFPVSTSFL